MRFPGDGSAPGVLANQMGQYIEFFHLVSSTKVAFRAFLTQFEDQFTSEWNEEFAFGRMDPISTFKKTGRKIALGWSVVAESPEHAVENLSKVSKLIRMLYPSYNVGSTISSTHISGPPLMKLRFMNLSRNSFHAAAGGGAETNVAGLLGYVDGFTNAPVLDDGFIEQSGGKIFPKTIQLACTFTVLHSHDLGWSGGFETDPQFRGGAEFPYGDPITQEAALEEISDLVEGLFNPPTTEDPTFSPASSDLPEEEQAAADDVLEPNTGGGGGGVAYDAP